MADQNGNNLFVDEFYLSALFDSEDGVLPVSDEKYAYELHLQEALVSALSNHSHTTHKHLSTTSLKSAKLVTINPLQIIRECGESSKSSSNAVDAVCLICMDLKTPEDIFANDRICAHKFCTECIATYLQTKVQENIATVECPEFKCKATLDPETCRSILPKEVYERWETALCESLILGSQKLYCPFKDCLALLVNDGVEKVTTCECPYCNRLFCAECKVTWHSGMCCAEFQATRDYQMSSEDLMAIELAKRNEWRRCPSCQFYVEKRDGCKHITCR